MRCPRNGEMLPFLGASPSGAGQGLANESLLLVMPTAPSVAIATPLTSILRGSWIIQNPSSLLNPENVSLHSCHVTDIQASVRWSELLKSPVEIVQKWLLLFSCWFFLSHPNLFFLE